MVDIILWTFISIQMIVWAWFMWKGGKLSDRQYFYFTIGMLLGPIGGGVNCFIQSAWPAFALQVYFFISSAIGGIRRYVLKEK